MRKLVVLERITLDGVFDATDMSGWDFPFDSPSRQAVIAGGLHTSDTYLLGRRTYELLWPVWSALRHNEFGVADQLNRMKKVVVSSTLETAGWHNSTILRHHAMEDIGRLKRDAGQDILVHGSARLVQGLLAADLVDELQLLVHPVVWGRGAKWFGGDSPTAPLDLIEARSLDLGVVLLRYRPTGREPSMARAPA